MIILPPPPAPAPIIAQYRHPAQFNRPPVGSIWRHAPIHQGYREGRPSPVIRYGNPVQVYGNKRGHTFFGAPGMNPRSMPTRQFNQRYNQVNPVF